ncbi:MAG: hypothetical protein B5M52_02060 [Helicobacteraceae bacterium 4484_230]|nr:MAG: hypothetical protein B5M52_02060 [Helicobacteraceae bacterium 4484_230]
MRLLFLLLTVLLTSLSSVEIKKHTEYEGPLKLSADAYGVAFALPEGWSAQLLGEEGPFFLQKQGSSMQVVMSTQSIDISGVSQYLNRKFEYDSGVKIFPTKLIRQISGTVFRRVYIVNGSDFSDEAVVYVILGPQGRGVVMTGFYAAEDAVEMENFMLKMAVSISFTALRQQSNADTPFAQELEGEHFIFYEQSGTYSEKREIWLCSDRTFVLKSHEAVASSSTRMEIMKKGKWSVEDGSLRLNFSNGVKTGYRLEREYRALLVNGQRIYRLKNNYCR